MKPQVPAAYRPAARKLAAPAAYQPTRAAAVQPKPRSAAPPPVYRPSLPPRVTPAVYRPNAAAPLQQKPTARAASPRFPQRGIAQPKLSQPDALKLYQYFEGRFGRAVHFVDWQPHHKAIVLGTDNLEAAKRLADETFEKHQESFKERDAQIAEIISALHDDYWIFSVGFTDGRATPQDDLIWEELTAYLKANKVQRPEEVTVNDGAKKTIFTASATYVLKIYPGNSQVYEKEKVAYQTLEQIDADMGDFVRQWGWNDQSRTALAEKMDGKLDKPTSIREAKRIVSKLKEKGYYITDVMLGDNVGHVKQRPVIFDVKSFAKWSKGAPYDVTLI